MVYCSKGTVETRVLALIVKHCKGLVGRSHTCPRTTISLSSLTSYWVEYRSVRSLCTNGSIVPCKHPVCKVVRCSTATVTEATTVVELACLSMVSIKHHLAVAVVCCNIHIVICSLESIRARIVDCMDSNIISLLEIPLRIVTIEVCA